MTKPLTAKRMLLNAATWASETSSPNAGAGTAGAVGSFWQRNGSPPVTPVELYLKQNSTAKGWVHQNLIFLNVFNVRNFGATGNGVTDDTAAINSAVVAATAAGGGTIYFPPGTYRVTKPASGFGSIQLTNVQNLLFLGDGYASLISMIGNANAGAWYMFRLRNCQHIKFANLNMNSNGVTNPDGAKQHHLITIDPQTIDAGGVSDIDVIGCYFTGSIGDCIRPLGNTPNLCQNLRILYNACTPLPTFKVRAFLEAQRFTYRTQCHYNWMTGSQDNIIDFEPTGGSVANSGPTEWSIIGNHIDMIGSPSDSITLFGISTTSPSRRILCHYNTITNGGPIAALDSDGLSLVGNIVIANVTTGEAVLDFTRFIQNVLIDSNVLISTDSTSQRSAISFQNGNGSVPHRVTITNNICQSIGITGGIGIFLEANEVTVGGNIIAMSVPTTGVGFCLRAGPQQVGDIDHITVSGNLGLGIDHTLDAGIDFHALTFNIHNTAALYNFFDNCQVAVEWDRATTETFLDYRTAANNNSVIGTTGNIGSPPTNVGVTLEGAAGPGTQIDFMNLAAGPEGNVTAPAGSLLVNQSGGQSGIVLYKETGTGVSGGNTGWIRIGSAEVTMGALASSAATAARFFAPGSTGLAAESATEIQWTVTRPCTIRNLYGRMNPGVGGGTNTFVLRKNGVNTTVTFAILNTATNGADTTHSFSCVAGDLISLQVTKSLAPGTPPSNLVFTFEVTG